VSSERKTIKPQKEATQTMFSLLRHTKAKSPVGPYPSYWHNGSYMPNPRDPTQDHLSHGEVWDQHFTGMPSKFHYQDSGIQYGSPIIVPAGKVCE
jgi:hypothetical protein